MRAVYLPDNYNYKEGYEITISILKFAKEFEKSAFAGSFYFSKANEHSEDFWISFVQKIESTLLQEGVRPSK